MMDVILELDEFDKFNILIKVKGYVEFKNVYFRYVEDIFVI